jgi:transposase-like protein
MGGWVGIMKGRYIKMEKAEIKKIVENEGSKSSKMIAMYNGGMDIGSIAKVMGVRYNFVYNVVSNDCRKNGMEVKTLRKQGEVKESIIALIKEGKSNTEISKELAKNYNYVFKVRKEFEAAK